MIFSLVCLLASFSSAFFKPYEISVFYWTLLDQYGSPSNIWKWFLHCCCCCVASVVSDSVRPHRRQPTRLPRPWDSPGKSTGVGCHCLLQCMKVKSGSEIAQLCPALCDPTYCSPPGSSAHGVFQVRGLEWAATAFSVMWHYCILFYLHPFKYSVCDRASRLLSAQITVI